MSLLPIIVLFVLSAVFLFLGINSIAATIVIAVFKTGSLVAAVAEKSNQTLKVTVSFGFGIIWTVIGLVLLGISVAFLATFLIV